MNNYFIESQMTLETIYPLCATGEQLSLILMQ